jgi:hypothetical protein
MLHSDHGRYGQAEPLYVQALTERRKLLGGDHWDTLSSVNSPATLKSIESLSKICCKLALGCGVWRLSVTVVATRTSS